MGLISLQNLIPTWSSWFWCFDNHTFLFHLSGFQKANWGFYAAMSEKPTAYLLFAFHTSNLKASAGKPAFFAVYYYHMFWTKQDDYFSVPWLHAEDISIDSGTRIWLSDQINMLELIELVSPTAEIWDILGHLIWMLQPRQATQLSAYCCSRPAAAAAAGLGVIPSLCSCYTAAHSQILTPNVVPPM